QESPVLDTEVDYTLDEPEDVNQSEDRYRTATRNLSECVFSQLSKEDIEEGLENNMFVEVKTVKDVTSLRLGTVMEGFCSICDNKQECPGHVGMYKLRYPIIHPMFINIVLSILRCLCKNNGCPYTTPLSRHKMSKAITSTFMTSDSARRDSIPPGVDQGVTDPINEDDMDYTGIYEKFASVVDQDSGISHCDPCSGGAIGNETFFNEMEIRAKPVPGSRVQTTRYNYNISTRAKGDRNGVMLMSIDDLYIRLKQLTPQQLRVLGIPEGSSHPSSLILHYIPVLPLYIRPAMTVLDRESEHSITRLYSEMIYHLTEAQSYTSVTQERYQYLASQYYSKIIGFPKKGTRDSITCKSMISRKEGLIRAHLLGKRCDLTGRSVLTEDINLAINQIGIPRSWADTITVHQNGFTRNLREGDYVIGNRNPTLTQNSMAAFKVKLHDHMSVAINPLVTASFNADHDGDEFNVFIPDGPKATREIATKMMIEKNIISRKNSKPCYGPIQDTVVALYLLSDESTILTKSEFMSCCPNVDISSHAARMGYRNMYTGRAMISTLFDDTFDYTSQDKSIVISKGILLKGRLNSNVLWKSKLSIIETYTDLYDSDKLVEFLTTMQLMCVQYMLHRGFTVSVNDYVPSDPVKTILEVDDILHEDMNLYDEIIEANQNNPAIQDQLEYLIYVLFANRFEKMSEVLDTCMRNPSTNPVSHMLLSESKGSRSNLMQAMVSIGQQTIASGRPSVNQRYEHSDEHSIVKQGYCYNSFFDGLTPLEFLFQSIAGREGNINTSINTELTGYDQRTMTNFTGPMIVAPNGTY
ncbi:DNA-directed RNA polymerase II subunit rpb1, partial [Geranomyces michiganensis]